MIIGVKVFSWKRKGFGYQSQVSWKLKDQPPLYYSIIRRLDPISYHLIKLIYGQKKLDEMAARIPEEYV